MVVHEHIRRRITSVHQIEVTSRCSLSCVYCPSPDIVKGKHPNRSALDMAPETFERTLEWVRYFVAKGTQGEELNLAGIGESTLHPRLVEFIGLARQALGPERRIVFATNGTHFTEAHAMALKDNGPGGVWVSMHRPEKAGPAIEIAKRYGVLLAATIDPVVAPNTWAGQVANRWSEGMGLTQIGAGYMLTCDWLALGRAFVLADGRVSACCLDAQGHGIVGHVDDHPALAQTKSYDLCGSCHHSLGQSHLDRIRATGGEVTSC